MEEDDAVKQDDEMLVYLTMKKSELPGVCKAKGYGQEQVETVL